jgi:hypothetical protein
MFIINQYINYIYVYKMTGSDKLANGESLRISNDYDVRASELSGITHNYMQQLASNVATALNAEIGERPQGTYEEKKALAVWVNAELRRLDLAIKCPKTGLPSTLRAKPGHRPAIGQFAIEAKEPGGKRSQNLVSPDLPILELMEATRQLEPLAEWHKRSSSSINNTKPER